jgi:hypothetical protein
MPHPDAETRTVFLVEPRQSAKVKTISVPMIENVLSVQCRLFGARAEPPTHKTPENL